MPTYADLAIAQGLVVATVLVLRSLSVLLYDW